MYITKWFKDLKDFISDRKNKKKRNNLKTNDIFLSNKKFIEDKLFGNNDFFSKMILKKMKFIKSDNDADTIYIDFETIDSTIDDAGLDLINGDSTGVMSFNIRMYYSKNPNMKIVDKIKIEPPTDLKSYISNIYCEDISSQSDADVKIHVGIEFNKNLIQ